ncbi:hypothetical protein [Paenibacillus cellulositrophicus]|uniref:hypothetical protein n=1 Tax=Paenibacillus cellulositrophicus TaxID=562959 RepID=UPI00142EEF1A|nr:hypothetical protein [Paenibacillus cellulositrophicus]
MKPSVRSPYWMMNNRIWGKRLQNKEERGTGTGLFFMKDTEGWIHDSKKVQVP